MMLECFALDCPLPIEAIRGIEGAVKLNPSDHYTIHPSLTCQELFTCTQDAMLLVI
jgi:hypothetical protein